MVARVRREITRFIESVPTVPESDLSYYYTTGSLFLGQPGSERTFVHLEGWASATGETRLAMEEAPACAPAIEQIESAS